MKEMNVNVKGMKCEHCVMHVKEALEEISNIKDVKVDLKSGNVSIKYENDLEISLVKEKIEEAGYSLK